ncbi:MAG TPA: hypothetical protein DEA82_07830 [Flavobacteriaceae bacterium]|nr:hypothetical protein [Flavobacteriaceae bacterium]MAY51670.1 hypothetical protein [Flavobacteriaceae bacterium]HBR54089.1 hypothetical protein [Flavobacteriaceae bacterium]
MLQTLVHYGLHFLAPLFIALLFFRSQWKTVYLILLATMLVDIDHLLATPIFAADRCSIGFHLFHSYWAILVYIGFLFFKKTRVVGIGLLLHMATDALDCWWMNSMS